MNSVSLYNPRCIVRESVEKSRVDVYVKVYRKLIAHRASICKPKPVSIVSELIFLAQLNFSARWKTERNVFGTWRRQERNVSCERHVSYSRVFARIHTSCVHRVKSRRFRRTRREQIWKLCKSVAEAAARRVKNIHSGRSFLASTASSLSLISFPLAAFSVSI